MTTKNGFRAYRRSIVRSQLLLAGVGLASVGTFALSGERGASAATASVPQPPAPNVMLLIDTSGSMENWPDGVARTCSTTVAGPVGAQSTAASVCQQATGGPNKWNALISALAGSFKVNGSDASGTTTYFDMSRATGTPFANEYALNGKQIYDVGYALDFHRPVSFDPASGHWCTVGPGLMPGATSPNGVGGATPSADSTASADAYAANYLLGYSPYLILQNNGQMNGVASDCNFALNGDGIIDSVRDYVRFGLMTFDSDTSPMRGITTGGSVTYTVATGNPSTGLWSYFPGWDGTTWTPLPSVSSTDMFSSPMAGNAYSTTTYTDPLTSLTCPPGWSQGSALPPNPNQATSPNPADPTGAGCTAISPFEVGARNVAAPPWEGRMVQFPDGRAPLLIQETVNTNVKTVLSASRPFGATPIAGLLEDSRNYFRSDPHGPERSDPFVSSTYSSGGVSAHGCRAQYQILLTDGAANLDLRPTCADYGNSSPTTCPYELPQEITKKMQQGVDNVGNTYDPVQTYVIGFGVETVSGMADCNSYVQSIISGGSNVCTSNICATSSPETPKGTTSATGTPPTPGTPAEACCNLISIACNGSNNTQGPFFASTPADLNSAFANILAQITRTQAAHVVPTFSTSYNSNGDQQSFTAEFDPTSGATNTSSECFANAAWTGKLNRTTTSCPTSGTTRTSVTQKYSDWLNSQNDNRVFLTAKATGATAAAMSGTIRPYLSASTDGFGAIGATEFLGKRGTNGTTLAGALPNASATQLNVPYSACPNDPNTNAHLPNDSSVATSTACLDYAVSFFAGSSGQQQTDGVGGIAAPGPMLAANVYQETQRAPAGSYTCNTPTSAFPGAQLGAIQDSNPTYSARPNASLADATYRAFAESMKHRPNVIYVATTDGALHAFNSDSNNLTTDDAPPELFTFLPPAVVPNLTSSLPSGNKILLDGTPVIADSVWERSSTTLATGQDWHTTLVSGFGAGGAGYFALDVTEPAAGPPSGPTASALTGGTYPIPQSAAAPYPTLGSGSSGTFGPHFLWQLTTSTAGGSPQLFGSHGGTPAIATVFAQINGSSNEEIGVAILPGGSDGQGPTGVCDRTTATSDYSATGYNARTKVRSWGTTNTASTACSAKGHVNGRSVSIVALNTGKIIKSFVSSTDATALALPAGTTTSVNFDSPMTGTPVVYPGGVGAQAQYIYISDADGLVWKIDVTSTTPANWKASLFFDSMTGIQAIDSGISASDQASLSQSLTAAPIVSIGTDGNILLNFATGDQTMFTTQTTPAGTTGTASLNIWNFVWSVSDIVSVSSAGVVSSASRPNWFIPFQPSTEGTTSLYYNGTGITTDASNADNAGERVTGPMSLFDGVLYFATFKPSDVITTACSANEARLYAVDYQKVLSGCAVGPSADAIGCGGALRWSSGVQFVLPADSDSTLAGALIPGVNIVQQTACYQSTSVASDNYFGTASSYQTLTLPQTPVLTYLGTSQTAGSTTVTSLTQKTMNIRTPLRTTQVDSWAAVLD